MKGIREQPKEEWSEKRFLLEIVLELRDVNRNLETAIDKLRKLEAYTNVSLKYGR